jgi:type 1 glutamine amidotransferase
MRRLLLSALVFLCAFAWWLPAAEAPAQKPKALRALLVCGGCCHDYTAQKKILSEGISARANVEWTIVQEDAPKGQDERNHKVSIYSQSEWWKGYDVVLHNDCFGSVNDNAFIEGITAAHQAGVPAVFLHCAVMSYRAGTTEEWKKCVGLTSTSHEKRRDLTVKRIAAENPVMKGFPESWVDKDDELYKNEKVWPDLVPLAKAYGEETKKEQVVIWTNTYGKGRSFSTSLGHKNETMSDPVYLDLVTRGLLWACDKLDENGKPKAGFEAAK